MNHLKEGGPAPYTARGAEVYAFTGPLEKPLIAEIRQYWKFGKESPNSELLEFPYTSDPNGPWTPRGKL